MGLAEIRFFNFFSLEMLSFAYLRGKLAAPGAAPIPTPPPAHPKASGQAPCRQPLENHTPFQKGKAKCKSLSHTHCSEKSGESFNFRAGRERETIIYQQHPDRRGGKHQFWAYRNSHRDSPLPAWHPESSRISCPPHSPYLTALQLWLGEIEQPPVPGDSDVDLPSVGPGAWGPEGGRGSRNERQ